MLGRRSLNLNLTSLDPEIELLGEGLEILLRWEITCMRMRMRGIREKTLIILGHLGICLHLLQQILLHV